jgi:hypothetical protein
MTLNRYGRVSHFAGHVKANRYHAEFDASNFAMHIVDEDREARTEATYIPAVSIVVVEVSAKTLTTRDSLSAYLPIAHARRLRDSLVAACDEYDAHTADVKATADADDAVVGEFES